MTSHIPSERGDLNAMNQRTAPTYLCKSTPYRDRGRTLHQLSFFCPKCRRTHYHGGGADNTGGHRAAACVDRKAHPRGYILETAAIAKAPTRVAS